MPHGNLYQSKYAPPSVELDYGEDTSRKKNDGPPSNVNPYAFKNSDLRDDFTEGRGRPKWMFSSYGPARNVPASLLEDIELSPEELRLQFYELASQGKQEQYSSAEVGLVNQAIGAMQGILNNIDSVPKFFENAEKEHPNRFDLCNMDGTKPVEQVKQEAQSQSQNPSSGPFGGAPAASNPFSQPAAPAAFGQPSQPSTAFGQPSAVGGNAFGKPSQPGGFGQPSFGQPSFGQPSQPSAFGQPSQPQPTSAFGQPSQPQQPSAFGQPSQPQPTSAFGQPSQLQQPSAFGQSSQPQQSSGFGQPSQQSAFGKPAFGQPSQPAFGSSGFGQPSQPSGFGQPSFGAPSVPGGLGQASTPAFGQPSAPTTAFGKPAFGAPSTEQKPSPFSQPSAAPTTGFGQPSFGQPSAPPAFGQPSQPQTTSPAPPNNPFGQPASNPPQAQQQPAFGATASPAPAHPTTNPFGGGGFGQPSSSQSAPAALPSNNLSSKPSSSGQLHPLTQKPTPAFHYSQTLPPSNTTTRTITDPATRRPKQILQTYKNRPVTYKDDKAFYERPDGQGLERIFFPEGTPGFNAEELGVQDEEYTEEVVGVWKEFYEKGGFGEKVPMVAPMVEWGTFDF